jgi:NADH:ubiquinone oxidoreductase subunit F (NADH-binding)
MSYLAGSSARQCGPCVFGLRAIAAAAERLAATNAHPDDLVRLQRWSHQVAGRGACAHPNGAATLMLSALRVFDREFALHHEQHRCSASGALARAA